MDKDERDDLVRRLFALLTGKLEDASEVAASGQTKGLEPHESAEMANGIHRLAQECMTVAEAVSALVEARVDQPS